MNKRLSEIMSNYRAAYNSEKAAGMKAYMKNKFEFLGLQKPERIALRKTYLKELKAEEKIDWNIVWTLWDQPEREFQYLALAYLDTMKNFLEENDINKMEKLIVNKSWWDSVDGIAPLVGFMNIKYPTLKQGKINAWINEANIWLIRVSIIFQLKYKENTDTTFLSKTILWNCGTKEFFINKSIGWALREYSKTDPDWVRIFINNNTLHSLSVREGGKYV
ncbi:MAG: DNA alkylation repair protein [Candidatus Marinimicrobia bacterium]|nr:DNA alkylation repair protein [Candidatus Neomarinimicrobiota bacterium]